mmetsp:Transcript_37110/g.67200  ORF Transcript_37110/g.67200 Transcript_37110/m.67200 type:complete len:1290 (+) Transcript_37110:142-4011(+)|eukprot:CAMPEP_0197625142 /NCGR_PEP_ID=MMETSP1338-20131121/4576_1 /TAXON_ID=43686 ORGANISM="Pelagodinium beii, Strain RCC1491" /NCGR_SAMPLE_ID=MMETSP1338 /ASSEMBLY_ACC=CAM_ASM_000754 /LENGTH=1289 /DNA_ID=CAMNT_0043195461 /DNA_START=73 /DNA_END=3942 /DNA_ORIENTATION=-
MASATKPPDDWFPSERELESWLLGVAGDTDDGAVALRSVLQKNPGVHHHLTGDEVLTTLVMNQAKRFRTRIMKAENPIATMSLYKPLCEVIWRIIGLVMNSFADFQGPGGAAEGGTTGAVAAAPFMLPKHCHGQLKMLLKTNEDLSFKFNEARRAYLRELAEHRDRQRRLGPEALQRLENLREQPVMFYEPLESILDETTKDFVREVVEERIKLEVKTDFTALEVEDEQAKRILILEEQLQNCQEEIESLTEERTRLNSRVEREAELKRRFEEASHQWKNQAKQLQDELAKKGGEPVALPVFTEPAVPEIVEYAPVVDDSQGEAARAQIADLQQKLKDMASTLEAKKASMEDLQQQLYHANIAVEEAEKRRDMEAEKASALQAQVAKFESSAKAPKKKQDENKAPPAPTAASNDDAQMKAEVANAEAAKASAEEKAKSLQKQLAEQAMKAKEEAARQAGIEKELKQAKESLEKALKEAESRARAAEKRAKAAEAESGKTVKDPSPKAAPEPTSDPAEEEIQRLEKKVSDKDKEISKLKAELEAERSKPPPVAAEEPRPVVKEKVVKPKKEVPDNQNDVKMQEMQERIEGLEEDINIANVKIKHLKKKLREYISENEMQELETKWEAELEIPGLFRKKKAYERLWDDAQRRYFDLQERQKRLSLLQNQAVEDATNVAKTMAAKEHAKLLLSLQQASASSTDEFAKSLQQFHEAHSSALNHQLYPGPGLDAEGAQCPNCGNVYMADAIYCRKCGQKREDDANGRKARRRAETDNVLPFRTGNASNALKGRPGTASGDGSSMTSPNHDRHSPSRSLFKSSAGYSFSSGPVSPTTRDRLHSLSPNDIQVTGESVEKLEGNRLEEDALKKAGSAADEIRRATKVLVQANPGALAAIALKEEERSRTRSDDLLVVANDLLQDPNSPKKNGKGILGAWSTGDKPEPESLKDSLLGDMGKNQVGLHKALSKAGVQVSDGRSRTESNMSGQAQKPTLDEVHNAFAQLVQPKAGLAPRQEVAAKQGRSREDEPRPESPEADIKVKGQKIEADGKERANQEGKLYVRLDGEPILPSDSEYPMTTIPAPRWDEASAGSRRYLGANTSAGGSAAVTYPAPRPDEMISPPPPSFGLLRNPQGMSGEVPGRVPFANPLPLPTKSADEGKARSASPSPRGAGTTTVGGRWPRQKELPQKLPAMAQTTIGMGAGNMGSMIQQQTWQSMAQIRSSPDLRAKEANLQPAGGELPKELVGLGLGAGNNPLAMPADEQARKGPGLVPGGKKFSTHQATTARLVVLGSTPA